MDEFLKTLGSASLLATLVAAPFIISFADYSTAKYDEPDEKGREVVHFAGHTGVMDPKHGWSGFTPDAGR